MRVIELASLYSLVGMGCALSLVLLRRQQLWQSLGDALLLVPLWPLYGPFLLLAHSAELGGDDGGATRRAIERASGTPLASLLPDEATARALERRLALARARVVEINALLAQPEFCEEVALGRQAELERRGDRRAAATARQRVSSIQRLRGLRDRFAAELDEISELLVQLRVQAELVRLSGHSEVGQPDLVGELLARLEGLDEMLGEADRV